LAFVHRVPVPAQPAGSGPPQATVDASQAAHWFAESQNFPAAHVPQSSIALQPFETEPQTAFAS
jgi:hypothetical protein